MNVISFLLLFWPFCDSSKEYEKLKTNLLYLVTRIGNNSSSR